MKLFLADFLFVDEHNYMNCNFVNAIKSFAEVYILSASGYYSKDNGFDNTVKIIDINCPKSTGKIGSRIYSLLLMNRTACIANMNSCDAILCLSFETVMFTFGFHHFSGVPFFLFHHKNIDELTNLVKRFLFNQYKNKVYHVVFEEFFAQRLTELGVEPDRIFVIPHPIKEINGVSIPVKYDCIGLCNSNEEAFIEEAISKENEFRNNNLSVLLRSKSQSNNSGHVTVIKGFLEKQKYDEIIASGKTVLVPLPATYIYRLSGSIYDALARRKIVLTTSKFYAEDYGRRYPGTCFYISKVPDLIRQLKKPELCNNDSEASFDMFLRDHSLESTSKALESMLLKILKIQ